MSVVTCNGDAYYAPVGSRCTFCGERSYPPYVQWGGASIDDDGWRGSSIIVICRDCCRSVRHGLMRDMMEVISRVRFRDYCRQPVQPEDVRQ